VIFFVYLVDVLRYFVSSPSPLLGLKVMNHDVFAARVFPALGAILNLLQALFDISGWWVVVIS